MSGGPDIQVGRAPAPPGVRTLLVFGGTFDPPHRAHITLPLAARDTIGADWLMYVPAAKNPLKSSGPDASGADRVDMLRAALEGAERISISTIELERDASSPSYTVDTLRELRVVLGESVSMRLLIGADQAVMFHSWREPREIIRLAEPLVMLRDPVETMEELLGAMRAPWPDVELAQWKKRIVAAPMIEASATRVRDLLRAGPDQPELKRLLAPGVLGIIRERGLYAG